MARNRPRSGGKRQSQERASGATAAARPQGASGPPARHRIWLPAALAAALIVAAGLASWLFSGPVASTASGPTVAAFVGSETCAGCHRAEADLWRTSQH